MGKKIEFPKNYERFLLKGTDLMNNGNAHDALECFEQAYERKKEKISNTLYATALHEVGEYQKAVEVAEEMLSIYVEDEYRHIFYTTLLIKAKKFLQAEATIKKQLENGGELTAQWEQLSHVLDAEKEAFNKEKKAHEQKLLKKLYAISDLSLEEQLMLMEDVQDLPHHLQVNGCKTVLQNPFASEIAKTAALHYLKDLDVSEPVGLLWFNEQREVRPSQLYTLEDHPILQEVRNVLERESEKDPSLFGLILQEAELHFMQMYPFVDDVITNPEHWVHLYFSQYGGKEKVSTDEKMESWFKKLTGQIH